MMFLMMMQNLFFQTIHYNLLDLCKEKISKKIYDSLQEKGIFIFSEKKLSLQILL